MTKKIGITGGIASGKSAVARMVESKGFPVFYSDNVAKSFLVHDSETIKAVKDLIGKDAYYENGEPNKKFIAHQIFGHDDIREKLNHIIHPKVKIAYDQFVADHADKKVVFHEAALMYQAGFDKFMDSVIFVTSSVKTRIERALNRDGITKDEILNRIKAQGNLEEFEKQSAFVIKNEGSLEHLESEVNNVINRINALN